jgi:hypothetical protein
MHDNPDLKSQLTQAFLSYKADIGAPHATDQTIVECSTIRG